MNGKAPDPRLDALLRDLPPPPVPAGLAARVLAAAAATSQETQPLRARRAARRDRRGRWLRRPVLAGTAALGLLVTSAVAATLAGVPIPQKIAAVFFPEEKAPAPKQAEPPRRAARPATSGGTPVQSAEAGPVAEEPEWAREPGPLRRLLLVQRMVDARRAMGLPTPGADRLERQLRRRAALWQNATPEQRAQWQARQQLRRDARRAMLATPEGRAALAERQGPMRGWRGQGRGPGAGMALPPEERARRQALLRQWRAQREAGVPLTPDQRAYRQQQFRAWRAQREAAGGAPLTEEQRMARQARVRQWREARRARWEARNGEAGDNLQAQTEGRDPPER